MSAARRPSPQRRPARGGAAAGGVRRPAASVARRTPVDVAPQPIEPRDARGIAAGLLVFAAGLAAGGVLVAARHGGGPAWSIAVAVGLLGIGAVGLFQRRTLGPVPRPAIWSPRYLADVATPIGVPVRAFAGVFYALLAVGVLGNAVLPIVRR